MNPISYGYYPGKCFSFVTPPITIYMAKILIAIEIFEHILTENPFLWPLLTSFVSWKYKLARCQILIEVLSKGWLHSNNQHIHKWPKVQLGSREIISILVIALDSCSLCLGRMFLAKSCGQGESSKRNLSITWHGTKPIKQVVIRIQHEEIFVRLAAFCGVSVKCLRRKYFWYNVQIEPFNYLCVHWNIL